MLGTWRVMVLPEVHWSLYQSVFCRKIGPRGCVPAPASLLKEWGAEGFVTENWFMCHGLLAVGGLQGGSREAQRIVLGSKSHLKAKPRPPLKLIPRVGCANPMVWHSYVRLSWASLCLLDMQVLSLTIPGWMRGLGGTGYRVHGREGAASLEKGFAEVFLLLIMRYPWHCI